MSIEDVRYPEIPNTTFIAKSSAMLAPISLMMAQMAIYLALIDMDSRLNFGIEKMKAKTA